MTTDQRSAEKMREEILSQAREEAKEIVMRAQLDAKGLLDNAVAEAKQLRQERLERAKKEAGLQSELVLATVPVETGRRRAARIEELLESVREEARRQLLAREGFEYREVVIALASDAIGRMTGDEFVVKLSGAGQAFGDDALAGEIAGRVGRQVSVTVIGNPDNTEEGVVVEDKEARQVWDNRFVKRLERLWPEMRRQIAMQAGFVRGTRPGGDGS